MPRQPSQVLNTERLMRRVEDRINQSFDVILDELGKLGVEVRKGNMDTELLTRRVSDLEAQVIETRDQMQKAKQHSEQSATLVANTAVKAAEVVAITAARAPGKVWHTKLGLITAISAAFVAVVAFANNLPKFVRGLSEVASGLWLWLLHHG